MRRRQMGHQMKILAILLLAVALASCAGAPAGPQPEFLFNDHLFTAASDRINAGDVFALDDKMRHYLTAEIADQLHMKGAQQGLIDALYSKNQLKIEYDSAQTRNAAQTFRDRAGNCLSLVIMTAALAKELGLPVRFQSVVVDESWTRSGGLFFSAGHVNLTVGKRQDDLRSKSSDNALITIDFVPLGDTRGQRSWPIAQETVTAMYMNNRAAEALARGQVNDAYWWAREAIKQDPSFLSAYNTLGVLYRRHGNLREAEKVFSHALEREPHNLQLMSNLAVVLNDLGRTADAKILTARVEQKQPYPPFYFFNLGQKAMQAGDYKTARDLFAREVARDPYNHEIHFWLAAAYSGLGQPQLSRRHLAIAMEFSTTRKEHELYAAKLDRLNAYK
jgi:Tfp pilus assembly protein PilF